MVCIHGNRETHSHLQGHVVTLKIAASSFEVSFDDYVECDLFSDQSKRMDIKLAKLAMCV